MIASYCPTRVYVGDSAYVSDDERKLNSSSDAADNDTPKQHTPCRQFSTQATSPVGPAEFLELYRTRTVSDPRSDQRLDALSRVRMKKVCSLVAIAYWLGRWTCDLQV